MWGKSSKQRKAAVRRNNAHKEFLEAVEKQKARDAGRRNCWLPPTKKRVVKKLAKKGEVTIQSDDYTENSAGQALTGKKVTFKRPKKLIKAQVKRARKAKVTKVDRSKLPPKGLYDD